MARKNLLSSLISGDAENKTEASRVDVARPRYNKGAIGAVSKSIADLKSRSVIDLDPHLIDAGGLQDRLETDPDELTTLMESIRDHGQQVPVLVRPSPDNPERYQIVYGRRRVLAMRDLGQTVKAMVRDLDDAALVMAQGQENNTRKDLSFIEKANFSRQMTTAGYDRKAICAAVNVDKTVISRMLNVAETLPTALIEMIGAAPAAGRDRWSALATLWTDSGVDIDSAADMIAVTPTKTSDDRFRVIFDWLNNRGKPKAARKPAPKPAKASVIVGAKGKRLARARWTDTALTLTLAAKDADGFDRWLANQLTDLHRDWLTSREDGGNNPS